MIRSTWYGRLLCALGAHRFEWRTLSAPSLDSDAVEFRDQFRCRRIDCPLSRRWTTVNRETRRPW